MLVLYRNGRRIVITGWRAWLVVGPAALLTAIVAVAVVSLLLSIALTLATVVLIGLPVAIVLVIVVQLLSPRR